ncbi:MAG: phenylalanine--tRNA ligase subunit beta [Candidatus Aureabacteria bacterium]|nr:phenylalanine--tRNA ligase subunit beta [Candidatus Auribacterota bacterium]
MKISFNWLTEYVKCGISPADLADRLTNSGLEVESVTRVSPPLEGIVVGRILSVEPHPNADRLSVCRVSDGVRELTIVCGAKNMKAGDCAPLARVGCALPNGSTIRAATLRGIMSEGMLCSERELGMGEEAGGIMILPEACAPGAGLADALHLNDSILDVNITPNRPDCLSVIGIAREVGAILGKRIRIQRVAVREEGEPAAKQVSVKIDDSDLCGRYSARLVRGVRVGPSPFWLRNRLGLAGTRAINNIVDVTNYVLLEYGQPLHAFDFGKIREGGIVVRGAREGERITAIDGTTRELAQGMLVIADSEAPIAIAGIMGGRESEVGLETKAVLLESAYFKPQSIRRTSTRLGLSSESSYRFERGVDFNGVLPALNRAAQLISFLGAGEICKGVVERISAPGRPTRLSLRVARVNTVLHTRLSRQRIQNLLTRLTIRAEGKGESILKVLPPSYRIDLKGEADLIEEVARLEGYSQISDVQPRATAGGEEKAVSSRGRECVRETLCSLGFSEAICLSFMGRDEMDRLLWDPGESLRCAVKVRNPVSEEYSYLRTSMLPPLMRCLALNASRGNRDVRLFELGNVFRHTKSNAPPLEVEKLALAAMGMSGRVNWRSRTTEVDYFYVKGVLESLLAGAEGEIIAQRAALPSCHPGRCATISWAGKARGWLAEIHPRVREAYGIRVPVVFAEVDAAPIYASALRERAYSPLPRFPSARRDIALVADEALEADKIIGCVRGAVPKLIERVEIFDLFKGQQIPADKKGLALTVVLRSAESTLSEEEIENAVEMIRSGLKSLGCDIRQQ